MKKVGNYENLQLIASTDAAEIYDACDKDRMNRVFILKKYKRSDISEVAVRREKEITQMIKQYASRSIVVPVNETVVDDEGSTYLVMYKENAGVFLSELIAKGTIGLSYALKCTEEVLRSLATLHSFAGSTSRLGYLHLDLHPGNVFMENADVANESAGTAKFIDFATAVKMINGKAEDRTFLAVSPFSAPELYMPYNAVCTVSTDLYSVAAIFYALFVGGSLPGVTDFLGSTKIYEKPAAGPNADTARNATQQIRKSCEMEGVSESVCRAVCAVMKCALNDNPAYRYRSAADMLAAVEKIERLLRACEEKEYETIFRMEYEDMTDIDDVHPETLEYDGRKFREAAESLEQMLKANQIDAAYTKYLFGLYWRMAEPHLQEMPGNDLTGFLNSGVAACNHTGDVILGQKLAALLTEKRKSIGIEEYLDLNNRAAVFVADGYEYARATEMLEKNVAALRRVRDGYVAAGSEFGMGSEDNVRNILLARALSALATYKAIAYPETTNEEIYALYDEAVREFGGGYNVKITQSRRMHYEMMIKDQESFEKTCAAYFDVGDPGKPMMMDELIENCVQKNRFGLYALVKALYVFYLQEVKAKCGGTEKEIGQEPIEGSTLPERDTVQTESATGQHADGCNPEGGASRMFISGHVMERLREIGDSLLPRRNVYDPVQTIFRYLGLLEYEVCGEVNERVMDYFRAALECQKEAKLDMEEPLNVYMLIAYQTVAIFGKLIGDAEGNAQLAERLRAHAEKCGWKALGEALDNGKQVEEILVHEYA